MKNLKGSSGHVVLVVAGLVLLVACLFNVRSISVDVPEVHWLRDNAAAQDYTVIELGEFGPGNRALAAWVDVPDEAQAFIDLSDSDTVVRTVGDTVLARVDSRGAPANGTGLPEDVVQQNFAAPLAAWSLVGLIGVAMVVVGARLVRRRAMAEDRATVPAASA